MMNDDAWLSAVPYSNKNPNTLRAMLPPGAIRQRFLFEIARLFRLGGPHVDRDISVVLAQTVAEPDFLHGLDVAAAPGCYARHAIFAAPDYCVLALVWMPGQMSPVHSHRAWCALGVHTGTLTETHFEPIGGGMQSGLRLSGCRQLHPGHTSHGPANEQTAHRVANLGVDKAISIHVYGTAFDRLGSDLNRVWAD